MIDPIITGKTDAGKHTVYACLFQWKDQEGVPLDMSAAFVRQHDMVTDWIFEIEGALWIGYTRQKIMSELNEAFLFLYPENSKALLQKVEQYFELRETPNSLTWRAMMATKPKQ
jgi:hypothetical protein